jgi:hypothetical protein
LQDNLEILSKVTQKQNIVSKFILWLNEESYERVKVLKGLELIYANKLQIQL